MSASRRSINLDVKKYQSKSTQSKSAYAFMRRMLFWFLQLFWFWQYCLVIGATISISFLGLGCSYVDHVTTPVVNLYEDLFGSEGSKESSLADVDSAKPVEIKDRKARHADNVTNDPPSPEHEVKALNIISARNLKESTGHQAAIVGIFPLNSNGDFVSVDEKGLALLWEGYSQKQYELLKLPGTFAIVEFSPKNLSFALANEGTATIYEDAKPTPAYSLTKLKNKIMALDIAPDAQSLLIGSADSRVYRWQFVKEAGAESKKDLEAAFERYVEHASLVSAVRYYPFGRIFISGDWLGRINATLSYDADRFGGKYDKNLFEARAFSEKELVKRSGRRPDGPGISLLRFGSDGNHFVLADEAGQLEFWEIRGFKKQASVQAHRNLILDADLNLSGDLIVSVGRDGRFCIWNIAKDENDKLIIELRSETKLRSEETGTQARRVRFLGPRKVALGFNDGKIQVVDIP